ncbi:MAG: 50S ribosomal protein L39e [Nitrososphaerales archaeon]
MGRNKTSGVKKRLYKKVRQSYSVPTWIMVRTNRKVRRSAKQRSRKRSKLKVR